MFHFFFVVVASLISVVGFDDADDKMGKFACVHLNRAGAAEKCILDLNLETAHFYFSADMTRTGLLKCADNKIRFWNVNQKRIFDEGDQM